MSPIAMTIANIINDLPVGRYSADCITDSNDLCETLANDEGRNCGSMKMTKLSVDVCVENENMNTVLLIAGMKRRKLISIIERKWLQQRRPVHVDEMKPKKPLVDINDSKLSQRLKRQLPITWQWRTSQTENDISMKNRLTTRPKKAMPEKANEMTNWK